MEPSEPIKELLVLFFFRDSNHLTAFVMPAFWANRVGKAHLTTVTALGEVQVVERIL
jgi:hypothetical protein